MDEENNLEMDISDKSSVYRVEDFFVNNKRLKLVKIIFA